MNSLYFVVVIFQQYKSTTLPSTGKIIQVIL